MSVEDSELIRLALACSKGLIEFEGITNEPLDNSSPEPAKKKRGKKGKEDRNIFSEVCDILLEGGHSVTADPDGSLPLAVRKRIYEMTDFPSDKISATKIIKQIEEEFREGK